MPRLLLAALLCLAAASARAQSLEDAFKDLSAQTKADFHDLARRKAREQGWRLTSPSIELSAALHDLDLTDGLRDFCGQETPLTFKEIEKARTVFGDGLDYSVVRLAFCRHRGERDESIASSNRNLIMIPVNAPMADDTFIHELTHVWQFQHGVPEVSDSALLAAWSKVTTGSIDSVYAYKLLPDSSLSDFGAEQQAHIVEDIFAGRIKADHPAVARIKMELSSSPRFSDPAQAAEDRALWLSPRSQAVPPGPGEDSFFGRGAPQLELDF